MPQTSDLVRVRALLDRDRHWAAYAIGDLDPSRLPACEWRVPADGQDALLLLYRAFVPPIAFAQGETAALTPLFAEIEAATVSMHLDAAGYAAMQSCYRPRTPRHMWRMALDPAAFTPAPMDAVVPLGMRDLQAVRALYEDGRAAGEMPTFFHPDMLAQLSFRGIREGEALIAIAGTHLFSAALGVCTVGNVYTRRDRRRRGLASQVTSAVVAEAIAQRIPTIVLNVRQDGDSAQRMYERLGFRRHCAFVEGDAERIA